MGVDDSAHLRAGHVREDRRACRAGKGRRRSAGGMYIAHIRSEGDRLLEALDESIRIAREADIPRRGLPLQGGGRVELAEAGPGHRQDRLRARRGARPSPPTCTPTRRAPPGSTRRCRPGCRKAASTAWIKRLKDPAIRAPRQARDGHSHRHVGEPLPRHGPRPGEGAAASPSSTDSLKPLTGKTLGEVARMRHKSPEETAMDLVIQDGTRVGSPTS